MPFSLTLAVADLQRTALFYREILEWEVEEVVPLPGRPAVLLLRRGATVLFFREMSALEALHPALFQNLERRPGGIGISLEFTVADLRPIRRAIERRRLHTLYELEDEEFGRREIWLHDPDGYLLVLQQET